MSERALDVLAFIERAMDPEAPLRVNVISRQHTTRELRVLNGHQRYLELKLAEQRALIDVLEATIRYKKITECPVLSP